MAQYKDHDPDECRCRLSSQLSGSMQVVFGFIIRFVIDIDLFVEVVVVTAETLFGVKPLVMLVKPFNVPCKNRQFSDKRKIVRKIKPPKLYLLPVCDNKCQHNNSEAKQQRFYLMCQHKLPNLFHTLFLLQLN